MEIARSRFPGLSNSLDALCKRFGVDLSKRVKHNAMLDCELLREVYINLLDAKEPKLVFDNHNNKTSSPKLANLDYSKKIINLSENEKKNHDNFLKKEMRKKFLLIIFFLIKISKIYSFLNFYIFKSRAFKSCYKQFS